jgi:hypothetical protein
MDEEVGIEMEVIQRSEATRVPNYTSRATLEVGLGDCSIKNKNLTDRDVDTTVAFPLGIIQVCPYAESLCYFHFVKCCFCYPCTHSKDKVLAVLN